MIRKAVPADIDAVVELGIESLKVNDPYEGLIISRKKIRELVVNVISSSANFGYVSEIDGKIVGALGAQVDEIPMYERKSANVLMFYCKESRDGGMLIKNFIRWYRKRPVLRMCVFMLESNADPRIGEFLSRLGLKRKLPCYVGLK